MSSAAERRLEELLDYNLKYIVHRYKYIRVRMNNEKVFLGWLKCIDPLTGTLILINVRAINGTFEVEEVILIRKPFIRKVDVLLEVDPEIKSFLIKLYAKEEAAVDEDRRDRLVAFIKKHRMPAEVSADGRNISTTGCTIQPPYNSDSCLGSNSMVVFSVGKVIKIFDSQNKSIEGEEAKHDEESDLKCDMQDLKLAPDQGGLSAVATCSEEAITYESDLMSGMQNLNLAPAQADLSSVAGCTKKDFLSLYDLGSSEEANSNFSSDNEVDFAKKSLKPTSSGKSSDTEDSFEFVLNERF